MGKHTYCAWRDPYKNYKKCTRLAEADYKGKPFCNTHLQDARKAKFDAIDYEAQENKFNKLNRGGA